MESRKCQLQKQIIEALNSNDKDLYALLKTQWAHRYGVESLEELNDLDLNLPNQNPKDEEDQVVHKTQDNYFEDDEKVPMEEEKKLVETQEAQILEQNQKIDQSTESNPKESLEIRSDKIVAMEIKENKKINLVSEIKSVPEVEALIPLPPQPKYSYLRRWIESRF